MYIFTYCFIQDDHFISKIDIHKKNELIKKYSFDRPKSVKEYWINNLMIKSSEEKLLFYFVNDKHVNYDNNYIIQECDKIKSDPFNFYKADTEEEYLYYENKIEFGIVIMKEYSNFLTIEYHYENKDNFYSEKIYI